MFPLRILHDTINSAVDILLLNSLNIYHRARFEIVVAVVRSAEHACSVILEVEFMSVLVVMFGG
jgi:hypothetical protein